MIGLPSLAIAILLSPDLRETPITVTAGVPDQNLSELVDAGLEAST